jgi:hypothetical protein
MSSIGKDRVGRSGAALELGTAVVGVATEVEASGDDGEAGVSETAGAGEADEHPKRAKTSGAKTREERINRD